MTAEQRLASDPAHSAWVSASAGTGKTKVLTDRVLRAMLGGTEPDRILCLTFTRAAAAEMSNRLNGRLAEWAVMPQEKLAAALADLTGETAESGQIDTARRLFARVLDAPGGLKILTIHAFCQSLVARFPLEAGIPPHFTLADERTADELLQSARAEVLQAARRDGQGPARLRDALACVTMLVDEGRFGELMAALVRERGQLQRLLDMRKVTGVVTLLAARLAVDANATPASVMADAMADGAFDAAKLKRAAEALLQGSATDKDRSARLSAWLVCAAAERGERFEDCVSLFLTQEHRPRARLATKGALASWSEAGDVLAAEAARLAAAMERRKAAATLRATEAVLILAEAILDRYARRKRALGVLDYDDLILAAVALLERHGAAAWVLYKLDNGLDHILVDEAQDTNPEQWAVVTALAAEFFAGEGARAVARTIFAVGDPKQSIFSFQRADPARFAQTREALESAALAAGLGWAPVPLDLSFRSTAAVLRAVDAVFAREEAKDGVVPAGETVHHRAHRHGQAGLVEVWPAAEPESGAAPEPWALPILRPAPPAPRLRVARAIARRIHGWITAKDAKPGHEAWLESKGRRIHAGDILVLVRRRGEFVEELVRELKALDVPVAGVDRMVLAEQLAVMDLIALGEVLLLPEDDLTLATVLKGPLIGLSEEDLFDLAHDRAGRLWDALHSHAGERESFKRAYAFLAGLRTRVDFARPYELYADLLNRGGRGRLLARLGTEAADPIEEFLSLALAYERITPPSLQGFLHWVRAGAAEIKRELDRAEGSVRVMTVHGAKGLQAPVVFLPDTMRPPGKDELLLWPDGLLLWPPRKALEDPFSAGVRAAARAERDREYRRLLYVAMTRAEDRLYVAGWRGANAPPAGNWYALIRAGLEGVAEEVEFPDGSGLRLATPQSAQPEADRRAAAAAHATGKAPAWIGRPPPPEPVPSRPLAPSRPSGDEPAVQSPLAGDDGARFRRGLIIHRLLQTLPDLEPAARPAAAARYLAQGGLGLDAPARAVLAQEALRLLEVPGFGRLFGAGSRAEVPIIGRLGETVVAGQVDRLVVDGDGVLIADYKTNRPPPTRIEDVSPLYLRQMACYRALLTRIYPERPVTCALVWTDGPNFMLIPNGLMDIYAP